MRILFVVSELAPLAKTGGLADVAAALPKALAQLGHQPLIFLPLYRSVRAANPNLAETGPHLEVNTPQQTLTAKILRSTLPSTDIPLFLVENDQLFDREHLYGTPSGDYPDNCLRFSFFCRAALEAVDRMGLEVDVIHAHDWQSGLVLPLAATRPEDHPLARAARLLTIHNLAYQGIFWHWDMPLTGLPWELFNWRQLEYHGRINLLKGAVVFADLITTVSPRYAREIQTSPLGCGLEDILAERADRLVGIVNGVDYSEWDPSTDPLIPANYSPDDLSGKARCKVELQRSLSLPTSDLPLVGFIGRLTEQKGVDLIIQSLQRMLDLEVQFVLLGTGEERYHRALAELGERFPGQARFLLTFDSPLAHRIQAGCDILLMPSRFEPCGLNQLYSLRYGTVPVARATGGLADTIVDTTGRTLAAGRATGFLFSDYSPQAMLSCLRRALHLYAHAPGLWRQLQITGMRQDFSWTTSAKRYLEAYQRATECAKSRRREVVAR